MLRFADLRTTAAPPELWRGFFMRSRLSCRRRKQRQIQVIAAHDPERDRRHQDRQNRPGKPTLAAVAQCAPQNQGDEGDVKEDKHAGKISESVWRLTPRSQGPPWERVPKLCFDSAANAGQGYNDGQSKKIGMTPGESVRQ